VKRLVDLTAEDLRAAPVWRYEGGTGADALAAPTDRTSLSKMDDEIFLAATDFELFDSTRHSGFCFPADDSGIDYLQPVIVMGSRHVEFWFDGPVSADVLARQWSALGKREAEIFPVSFRCLVPVDGRTVSGRIPGVEFSHDAVSSWPSPPRSMAPPSAPSAPEPRPTAERALTARPVSARQRAGRSIDRRTARRRHADMTVEFTSGGLHGTGVVRDVSRRGMFVRASSVPETGPALRLTVHLSDGRKLVLTGRVVRKSRTEPPSTVPRGFGFRLADEWPDYEDLFRPPPEKDE
jgi:hypothetical protein